VTPSRAPSRPGRGELLLAQLPARIRLHWRLVRDRRVPPWAKALLGAAVVYVILPFDLIPDTLPVVGEVDDVVVLIMAARWFLRLCPPAVVAEHARALGVRTT
jgi:uncharacterized membrane protein YkvA (DUF1232 family)